jgi:hypothetical protein
MPADALPYLGRVLLLASATALADPANDPLVLARSAGSADPFAVAARSLANATTPVTTADYDALQATPAGIAPVALTGAPLVYVGPVLAQTGFQFATPPAQPTSTADTAWARLTNMTGLIVGQTKLGDELSSLYPWADVTGSVFAGALSWRWDGETFAPPA